MSLSRNIVESNVRRLPFPYKLTFVVTYHCNYKCKTCDIWKRKPKNELTLEEIDSFFASSNRFNWIDLTGGEVWLRPDFVGIAEACIRHCRDLVLLHFPTNGFQTDRIVAGVREIVKFKPPKLIVTVSTDGDEAMNDHVRGREGGWRRQMETYKQLHAMDGVDVVLGMTLSAYNAREYDKAFAAAKRECPWLEPADFHMNIAHESGHYYDNENAGVLEADTETLIEQVEHYRTLRGRPHDPVSFLEDRYLKNVAKYLRTRHTPMPCHSLQSSCFIDSWGWVYPCGMYDAKIANLRDHDYDLGRIWNLPRTKQLQKEIFRGQCPQCWTPCEAYQTIFGNLAPMNRLVELRPSRGTRRKGESG